jgi:ABC-type multidrug transport system fused ATPase/permease subunit
VSSARNADRIAVLRAGIIVEVGSHDELLALGGRNEKMWSTFALMKGKHS